MLHLTETYCGKAGLQKGGECVLVNAKGHYVFIYKPEVKWRILSVEPPAVIIQRGKHKARRVPLKRIVYRGMPPARTLFGDFQLDFSK